MTEIQTSICIEPHELLGYIRWIIRERDEFVRLSHDLVVHQCHYEDLVLDLARVEEPGGFLTGTRALAPIAEFLQVPNRFRYAGRIRKAVDRPYAEFVENYDELVAAVASSEFSGLLHTA